MGRLEDRLRRLEETVEAAGWSAAFSRLEDADVHLLADAARKAVEADEAGKPRPLLGREEREAQGRLLVLREEAIRAGWREDGYRIV